MYSAIELAKYIITLGITHKKPVTNLKLQKLLYYAWIEYYKQTGKELFCEDICAWQLGPVIPEVYFEYCAYGGKPIDKKYDVTLSPNDVSVLENIVNIYNNFSASKLVDKSHHKDGAWDLIYNEGLGNKAVIPFNLIKLRET